MTLKKKRLTIGKSHFFFWFMAKIAENDDIPTRYYKPFDACSC